MPMPVMQSPSSVPVGIQSKGQKKTAQKQQGKQEQSRNLLCQAASFHSGSTTLPQGTGNQRQPSTKNNVNDNHQLEDSFEDCIEQTFEEDTQPPSHTHFPAAQQGSSEASLASAARVDTASSEELVDAEGDDGLQQAVQQGLEAGRDSINELVTKEKKLNEEVAMQRAQAELDADGPVLLSSNTKNNPLQAKVTPQDFEMLRVVGQGAFGKVLQVQHKASGGIHAMKIMKKERILQRDHSEYVRSERDVLTSVVHPYIVNLRCSFQTQTKLYLVLEFINGGHLFFNLYRQGVFDEGVARLYTAEIVSAIGYLHSIGIMHRDLKPENVLLDSEGHVKLTDFGLAKSNMGDEGARSNSFIGTMEYMAPEIIAGKGHTKDVDWWSTGILLYEMLCGVPPFRAKSRNTLQTQILSSKVKYPKFLSSDALNLLKALLTREPSKRLGAGPHGAEAVRRHPFFKSINWAKLEMREVESKFRPAVSSRACTANFDKLWTDQLPEDSPCNSPQNGGGDPCGDFFKGFTYVAPGLLDSAVSETVLLEQSACSERGGDETPPRGDNAAGSPTSHGYDPDKCTEEHEAIKRSCSSPLHTGHGQVPPRDKHADTHTLDHPALDVAAEIAAAGNGMRPGKAQQPKPHSKPPQPAQLPKPSAQPPQAQPPPLANAPQPQPPHTSTRPPQPQRAAGPPPPRSAPLFVPTFSNNSTPSPSPPPPRRQTGFVPSVDPMPRDMLKRKPLPKVPSNLSLEAARQQGQHGTAQQPNALDPSARSFCTRT